MKRRRWFRQMSLLRRSAAEPPPELIFDWGRSSWTRRRLLAALAAGVLITAGWFYLFRVSLPDPGRAAQVGRSLSVADDPALSKNLRTLLSSPRRELPLNRSLFSDSKEALQRVIPAWQPSWVNRAAALRELPPASSGRFDLPAIIPSAAVLLPPVEGSEPLRLPAGAAAADPEAPPVIAPLLTVQEGLGGLTVSAPPRWKPEIFDEGWPASGTAAFSLAVDENGRTVLCFPVNASSGTDEEKLRPELIKLRWSPLAGRPLVWGKVQVRW